ncbi:hypothetical protein [Kineococcus sp. SYSU DK001]|uniref:hypothetical protein n=1 Tax=Kineococcus sp. SYSU DK001 TaxID=3383122 RepID=UPI003D7E1F41
MSEFDDEELDARERHVRDLLRGAADVGPMPADVVARLDAALAAARDGDRPAASPVASLSARRRWSQRLPRLVAAAAAAVVVGGGALHLALDDGLSSSSSSSAGGGAADSAAGALEVTEAVPPATRVLLSGTDYTDVAAVQDLGEDSLASDASGDASTDGGAADDATPGTGTDDGKPTLLNAPQSGPESEQSATSDPSQLPNAERALACTRALGVDPTTVKVVEIANWRSQPAAFVVHTTPDGAQVVVVALGCSPGDEALSTVPVP